MTSSKACRKAEESERAEKRGSSPRYISAKRREWERGRQVAATHADNTLTTQCRKREERRHAAKRTHLKQQQWHVVIVPVL